MRPPPPLDLCNPLQPSTTHAKPKPKPKFGMGMLYCALFLSLLFSALLYSTVSLLLLLSHFIQAKTNLSTTPLYYSRLQMTSSNLTFSTLNLNPNQTQPMGCAHTSTSEKFVFCVHFMLNSFFCSISDFGLGQPFSVE